MAIEGLFRAIVALSPSDRAELFARIQGDPKLRAELHCAPENPENIEYPKDVHYLVVFDGGSLGNPGKGYGSYVLIRCDTGQRRIERVEFPEAMTNNEAEYRTLIEALRSLLARIREHGKDPALYRVEIRGDSKLVVNQINGTWKAQSPRMRTLRDESRNLLEQFGFYRLIQHPREYSVRLLGH